jgi:hypothetical protein
MRSLLPYLNQMLLQATDDSSQASPLEAPWHLDLPRSRLQNGDIEWSTIAQ